MSAQLKLWPWLRDTDVVISTIISRFQALGESFEYALGQPALQEHVMNLWRNFDEPSA